MTKIFFLIFQNIPLTVVSLAVGAILFVLSVSSGWNEQSFVNLAASFLQGSLHFVQFIEMIPSYDTVLFQGERYWPLGPFPAILLMPFVAVFSALKIFFYQGYLQVFIVAGVAFCVYTIARALQYTQKDSAYSSLAFIGGTLFIGSAALSSYSSFAHTVAVLLLVLSLAEYCTKKRWWLIGLIMGLAFATRMTAGIGILFFILGLLFETHGFHNKLRTLAVLLVPFAICVLLIGFYNYVRFNNFFESGYSMQQLYVPAFIKAKTYGLKNVAHIPGNLYYAFLAAPTPVFRDGISHVLSFPYVRPDPWGMGIFYTSPYLLLLFLFPFRDLRSRLLLVTTAAIALPLLLYYGIGYIQFGYRYALDFMPFLFLAFLIEYRILHAAFSKGLKSLFLLTAMSNLYLLLAFMFR